MDRDSELESLQCYPFHLPEPTLRFVEGHSGLVELLRVPAGMLQQPLGSSAIEARWSTSEGAIIIRDLLDMAGIPIDEQGGDDERD